MSSWLPLLASALVQWWIWSAILAALALAASSLGGARRAHYHDWVLRGFVVVQAALLAGSLALALAATAPETPLASAAAGSRGAVSSPAHSAARTTPGRGPPAASGETRQRLTGDDADDVDNSAVENAPPPPLAAASGPRPVGTLEPRARRLASVAIVDLALPEWGYALGIAIYILGVLLGLFGLAADLLRGARLRALGEAVREPAIRRDLQAACRRLRIAGPVEILAHPEYTAVLLIGWRRPAILLPSRLLERLDPGHTASLLIHELAHHRRRDLAWRLLHRAVAVLSWPSPLNPLVARRLARTSEILCDRLATVTSGAAEEYARALVEALRLSRSPRGFSLATGAVASRSFLRRRMEMILENRTYRPLRISSKLGLVLLVVTIALPVAALRVAARPEDEARDPPAAEAKPPPPVDAPEVCEAPAKQLELPEHIRQAQKRLADLFLEQAAVEYRAGRYEASREYLRRAHRLGGIGREVVPLSDQVGVLAFTPAGYSGWSETPLEHPGPYPFLLRCIEREHGPLERKKAGFWVDEKEGMLVARRFLLEKIRRQFFPEPGDQKPVVIKLASFSVDATAAARCLEALGIDRQEASLDHELSAEQSRALDAWLKSQPQGMKVASMPQVAALPGEVANVVLLTQEAYIEKYRLISKGSRKVADPVASVLTWGDDTVMLPLVEGDAVRLFVSTRVKRKRGFETVVIDLPNAHRVPISVPDIEQNEGFYEVVIPRGKQVLLGKAPEDSESYPQFWLRVEAEVGR
jgi:beta-lactamase regulating signal transducer with metallopeptidase domain